MNGADDAEGLLDDLGLDDLDDECDLGPEYEMEIGLPLRAENFAGGEPRVTVDYFGFEAPLRDRIAGRLCDLRHAVIDEGADQPRILLFQGRRADGTYDVLDLVAILTVREADVRVETARRDVTGDVRRMVEAALGDDVRHLRRASENPLDVDFGD